MRCYFSWDSLNEYHSMWRIIAICKSYSVSDIMAMFCMIMSIVELYLSKSDCYFNSLAVGRFEGKYWSVIFKLILRDW